MVSHNVCTYSLQYTHYNTQEFQGGAECALAQIVGGRGQTWEGELAGGLKSTSRHETPSKVIVRAEEVADSNALVNVTLSASNLR